MSRPSAEDIFYDSLDRSQDDRDAFITRACGDDQTLASEVRSLLQAHQASEGFLETPVLRAEPGGGGEDPALGKEIGAYRIVEQIGSGGMGRVYLAERADGEFDQRVAIKLILRGAFDEEALRRFRTECRVLARLEHPNIARMIDGGLTSDGTPYITMEYIDGQPIDKYCEQHALDLRKTLRLFLGVCAAVEHVHRHSTIHRDIKPSNVLVDREGNVKLVDFGIARALDAAEGQGSDRTATANQVLTPQYASPEQLRGEMLSTASDVYSLGVVLYRLLTGNVPFRDHGTSLSRFERTVSQDEPVAPSQMVRREPAGADTSRGVSESRTVSRELRGDVDTIVLMAIRKEPERRYASVAAFSDDIRRYLDGRPVHAQPDTFSYRTAKFVRRNAGMVIAGALLFAVLVASTIIGFWLYLGAEDARRVAEAAREEAESNARSAQAATDFLVDIFKQSDPDVTGGKDLTAGELLAIGTERLDTLKDEPRARVRLLRTISEIYRRRGDVDKARELGEQAVTLSRVALDDPFETAQSLTAYGILLTVIREHETALHAFLEAESLTVSSVGADDDSMARILNCVGIAYLGLGDLGAALPYMERSAAARESVIGSDDPEMAYYWVNLAELNREAGNYQAAEPLYTQALAVRERHLDPMHPQIGFACLAFGAFLNSTKQYQKARETLERSRDIHTTSLGKRHLRVATSSWELGRAYAALGEKTLAEDSFNLAISIYDETYGPDGPWAAEAICGLAGLRLDAGNYDAARELYQRAHDLWAEHSGDDYHKLAEPLVGLAQVAAAEGKADDAERRFAEALSICEAGLGENHPLVPEVLLPYAALLRNQGRTDEAVVMQQKAATILASHGLPHAPAPGN